MHILNTEDYLNFVEIILTVNFYTQILYFWRLYKPLDSIDPRDRIFKAFMQQASLNFSAV